MKPIKVNGDYELELFHNQKGPKIVNETLEFLAFFLSDRPVFSTRQYSDEYLAHVESLTGRKPRIVRSGDAENWWGALADLEHESWMNSKLTSAAFNGYKVLYSAADFVDLGRPMLVKYAFGMSGRGIHQVRTASDVKQFPCILEPFFERVSDFSHYVYPDGTVIAYENFIDDKFQYKGTLFKDYRNPVLGYDVSAIREHYEKKPLKCGYSIDSFVHSEGVRLLSEVNYRRTMGQSAWELSKLLAPELQWGLFVLGKMETHRQLKLSQIFHLTPEGGRFEAFLIKAKDEVEGKALLQTLKSHCQLSIQI